MSDKTRNILLTALFLLVTLFTAFNEGYVTPSSEWFLAKFFPFWLVVLAGFVIAFLFAPTVGTGMLTVYILVVFIVEYIKETTGIVSGAFAYHGKGAFYNTGVWLWVLGSIMVFAISTHGAVPLLRRLKLRGPGWANRLVTAGLFLFMALSLGPYRDGTGPLFWALYAILFIIAFIASGRMSTARFAGIVLTSWAVGNMTEYLGSAKAGIWTFTHNPEYPPLFLLFGCWPLEILSQYCLATLFSGEPLDP